jgi:hypothetical protein
MRLPWATGLHSGAESSKMHDSCLSDSAFPNPNRGLMTLKHLLFFMLLPLGLLLSGCKPDKAEIELYTQDIRDAQDGEVIEVSAYFEFGLLGDDEEGNLEKARTVAQKYLPEDSTVEIAEGDYGKKLTVRTTLPMGMEENLDAYLQEHVRLLAVSLTMNRLELQTTAALKAMNEELSDINFMLEAELPAETTFLRIIGDDRKPLSVSAIAVFVNSVPYLTFSAEVPRRKTEVLEFKGGDGSVYSQLPIQLQFGG